MNRFLQLLFFFCVPLCSNAAVTDTAKTPAKLSVLVLPPYDFIANEGISPGTQQYLERLFAKDSTVTLIKFPYKKLMNVPYQNVFDKKYCRPILAKIKCDIIIMTMLEQQERNGSMATDKWNLKIKIYNTINGRQINSSLIVEKLTGRQIEKLLLAKYPHLTKEIESTR